MRNCRVQKNSLQFPYLLLDFLKKIYKMVLLRKVEAI